MADRPHRKIPAGMTHHTDMITCMSVVILTGLFMVQRFGTDKIGYTFAPTISIWFKSIGAIVVYNFFKFDPLVVKAINSIYMVDYFMRNKKEAWISLGSVILATIGSEALFADVGHFSVHSIKISVCAVTYSALTLAYTGQATYLRKNNNTALNPFFKSIPEGLFWPMFTVALLASIIASQAMITGTFSLIQKSLSLGCFPPVKIVHTSLKHEGQIYIPEINYFLMIACIGVTLGFKNTTQLGNAYATAKWGKP